MVLQTKTNLLWDPIHLDEIMMFIVESIDYFHVIIYRVHSLDVLSNSMLHSQIRYSYYLKWKYGSDYTFHKPASNSSNLV